MPKRPRKNPSRLVSVLFMLVNTITWGAALPIVKPALSIVSPFEFLLFRYMFAVLFSLPILIYFLPKIRHLSKVLSIIIPMELLGTTLALSLLYFGLEKTSSIDASLIATTTPVFITLGGVFFLKEKEELHEWWGLWLAVAGTIMLAAEPLLKGALRIDSFSNIGNLLVLLQNIAIAAYFLLAKRVYKGIPKLFITTISFYVGLCSFALLSLFEMKDVELKIPQTLVSEFISQIVHNLSYTQVLVASLYMAIFGSIVGLTAYIKAQEGIEASEASLFTYLQPLVFLPLGIFMLKEHLTWWSIFSIVLIFSGVFLAEIRTGKN